MGGAGGFFLASRLKELGNSRPKKLILQAVGAAYGKAEPPAELELAWRCQSWGALPEGGGMFDQDHILMQRMTSLSNVYNFVSKLQTLKGNQIHSLTASERRIWRALINEGIL